jgi:hypothetical protein
MKPPFEIINPLKHPHWNDLVIASKDCSFFHSSNWARVLYESYGYEPVYFAIVEEGRLSTLIPLMDVRSFLTGRRGISLPFTDYCEPIIHDDSHLQAAMPVLAEHGRQAAWKYIELRGADCLTSVVPWFKFYYGHILSLRRSDRDILSGFRDSTKRNISKAEKHGVRVEISSAHEALEEFYRLNCMTRKLHGLPPQPFRFFKKIYDHIISQGLGMVALASYLGKCVAGAVFFNFGERAVYKYGASDRSRQELRGNNLVMWEAIRWYSGKGYDTLCFGRTEPDAAGLRQFKGGWGATERIIKYCRYDPGTERFMGDCSAAEEKNYALFSKLPVSISKIAGRILYRHVG